MFKKAYTFVCKDIDGMYSIRNMMDKFKVHTPYVENKLGTVHLFEDGMYGVTFLCTKRMAGKIMKNLDKREFVLVEGSI